MTKINGKDFLDEILSDYTEVEVLGKTVTLGLPTEPELVKVRLHADITTQGRLDYAGGALGWSTDFYALCLAATVKHSKKRSLADWRILASISDSLCHRARSLCGYPSTEAEQQMIEDEVKKQIEKTGEAISPLVS